MNEIQLHTFPFFIHNPPHRSCTAIEFEIQTQIYIAMKKLFLLAALFVAAAFSSCSKHDDVDPIDPPDSPDKPTLELAIVFDEGNSLQFNVNETKTVHYTITGGGANLAVTAEMQKSDGAYTVETTPTSATKGTITITAKTPETDNRVIITVSDGSQTVTAEIAVSTNAIPQELAIAFDEGDSLEFGVDETKTVHYTITGGSDNTVVKAEMQTPDGAYTVETTPTSATEGTIAITAKLPTENCVIVTVSDSDRSITAEIAVALKTFDGKTAVVVTPGTLSQLLADYDTTKITELTVIGNLNDEDIATLKNLSKLAILDMESANLEALPSNAFYYNKSLTSVKLPKTLKTIGEHTFYYCTNLTSITIPDSVTSIENGAFWFCSGLTSITIPNSVTEIGEYAFRGCSSLTSVTIPDSVTSIGHSVFGDCSSLTAFYGKFASSDNRCLIDGTRLFAFAPAGLTSYTVPDGVTYIGEHVFSSCSDLTNLTIPDSVITIKIYTFSKCNSLTNIYCKAQTPPNIPIIPEMESYTLVAASVSLYVPIGCADAYRAAKIWKNFSNIIEMEF
ncbi:MAG: leucine-rich repeat domain-containing protein [Alistipes senegalensis]|nr:leucine-rich repeat domain-containing protein [Bacteroides cellulosilyticus]MCM1351382.1 leucine-rich repeat domain-containing protein [Alistipes senegalensis]